MTSTKISSAGNPDHPYTYIFIRKDLSFAQQIVQSGHAALESGFLFDKPEQTSSVIVCGAKGRDELSSIGQHLEKHGIRFTTFYEPDLGHDLVPMGYTAICTEPLLTKEERRPLRKYRLYNPSAAT